MNAERVALNTTYYQDLSSIVLTRRLAADTAAMTQEMAPRTKEPITPFTLKVDFTNHQVTSPDFSSEPLGKHTSEDMTGIATRKIETQLLDPTNYNSDQSIAIVWVSGPGQDLNGISYTESRYNIYFGNRVGDQAIIRSYGGLATKHTEEECLVNGKWLSRFSKSNREFTNITDLRVSPIVLDIPSGVDPFDFISTLQLTVPEEVWRRIRTGQAEKEYQTALRVTTEISEDYAEKIKLATTEWKRRQVGAEVEREIMNRGFTMVSSNGGHGGLNSESSSVPSMSFGGETHWFVRNCGNCKITLYKWMKKNDTCPCCNGVYEGC